MQKGSEGVQLGKRWSEGVQLGWSLPEGVQQGYSWSEGVQLGSVENDNLQRTLSDFVNPKISVNLTMNESCITNIGPNYDNLTVI